MSNICLFEVDAVDVDRFYVVPMNLTTDTVKLVLIDDPSEYRKYLSTGRLRDGLVICTAWFSIDRLATLLIENDIEVLLTDSHRVVDLPIILAARDSRITISYTQHGIYLPFMKRSAGFFLRKITKTFRYLYYAVIVAIHQKNVRLALELIGIHVFGCDRTYLDKYPHLFADQSVVFSDYWAKWHVDFYRFPNRNIFPVGATDFRKFEFTDEYDERYISYCYQTLVEDGRIEKELMFDFYNDLNVWRLQHGLEVLVKWHPRGDNNCRDHLCSLGWAIVDDRIPNTQYVIGHYSSLLSFWGIHGRTVITLGLEGHDIIESFRDWTVTPKGVSEIDLSAATNLDKCRFYFGSLASPEEINSHLKLT